MNDKLDEIIARLQAQQPELTDADELTERIMQNLPEQPKARVVNLWQWIAAAACVAAIVLGAWMMINPIKETPEMGNNMLAQETAVKDDTFAAQSLNTDKKNEADNTSPSGETHLMADSNVKESKPHTTKRTSPHNKSTARTDAHLESTKMEMLAAEQYYVADIEVAQQESEIMNEVMSDIIIIESCNHYTMMETLQKASLQIPENTQSHIIML